MKVNYCKIVLYRNVLGYQIKIINRKKEKTNWKSVGTWKQWEMTNLNKLSTSSSFI
jgi:hypothetical protein